MADIVNEDSRRHDIQIDSRNTWIDAGARMSGEASTGATIQIVGGPGKYLSAAVLTLIAVAVLASCGGGGGGGGAAPAPLISVALPETGQTLCYDAAGVVIACASTGQDGDLKAGVAWPDPRFTVGVGAQADCVTDNLTGLMWVKAPNAFPVATWANALSNANNLDLCGFTDWRLPNQLELHSLTHYNETSTDQSLNTQGFTGVGGNYWSSSTWVPSPNTAWYATTAFGYSSTNNKIAQMRTWPVRGASASLAVTGQNNCYDAAGAVIACAGTGQDGDIRAGIAWPSPRFTVGTGAQAACVTDSLTGLTWVQAPSATAATWVNALASANNLDLCGFADWRLPNANELLSLVNLHVTDTISFLNAEGFTMGGAGDFWSSTTSTAFPDSAYLFGADVANSDNNTLISDTKTLVYRVWPVRGGQ